MTLEATKEAGKGRQAAALPSFRLLSVLCFKCCWSERVPIMNRILCTWFLAMFATDLVDNALSTITKQGRLQSIEGLSQLYQMNSVAELPLREVPPSAPQAHYPSFEAPPRSCVKTILRRRYGEAPSKRCASKHVQL